MMLIYSDNNGDIYAVGLQGYLVVSASGWEEEFDSFEEAIAQLSYGL